MMDGGWWMSLWLLLLLSLLINLLITENKLLNRCLGLSSFNASILLAAMCAAQASRGTLRDVALT